MGDLNIFLLRWDDDMIIATPCISIEKFIYFLKIEEIFRLLTTTKGKANISNLR